MDLATRVHEILKRPAPAGWRPTGTTRAAYLDLMEHIVRVAAGWQDDRGAIIDPVEKSEHGQTSCRFVSPGAILLSAGRIGDLREQVLRGMDFCCMRLASGEGQSPDFWMRELMTAWRMLGDAPQSRRDRWEADIRSVDPERVYWVISPDGSKLTTLNNWTVYAAAGEAMRQVAGLGPLQDDGRIVWGGRFFEKYMPAQLVHFSELGMYRDPNDPFTYDMTTRLQIAAAFEMGFVSPLREQYDDLLRRGALAQLLYVSPAGYSPFGGRSNQMHLQEAILAALCELEARRYKQSDPQLAGAFKRQARRCGRSIERWITGMTPMRHLKNGFDPSMRHGCEDYAKWSVYSLFAASCLGLAWLFADESIEETPAPSEIGGYVLEMWPAFHKVFATCGGTQLEIDTEADPHYDATGLGRFHRDGVPLELGLSMPLPSHPKYRIGEGLLSESDLAIGPGWKVDGAWVDLASLHDGLEVTSRTHRADAQAVELSVRWEDAAESLVVRQQYRLTAGHVAIRAQVMIDGREAQEARFSVPLLVTDGTTATQIEREGTRGATVHHPGGVYRVAFEQGVDVSMGRDVANRNGIYRPMVATKRGGVIEVELSLSKKGEA